MVEDYEQIADEVSCDTATLQIWHDGKKNTTECGENSQCFRDSESIVWKPEVSKQDCEKRVEAKKMVEREAVVCWVSMFNVIVCNV